MSEASLAREGEQVRQIVDQVARKQPISATEAERALDLLEQYECWQPMFSLIDRLLTTSKTHRLPIYVRKARVQNLLMEDVFAAADTCMDAVTALKLSFDDFQFRVIPSVIERDDWAAEAVILQALVDSFSHVSDRIRGWERLCLLFEKKVHNEEKLADCYERLHQLDPYNIKALRYFKMVYSQGGAWPQVAGVLKKLVQVAQHPQDVYRTAQELAAVQLYQLDKPKLALELLAKHCQDSPLDTSMIKYDAYMRLDDLSGALNVLYQCVESSPDQGRRAILFFKAGLLNERMRDWEKAWQNYEQARQLAPDFLEPIEQLLNLAVRSKDWGAVESYLRTLKEAVLQKSHQEQLQEALLRLQEGLSGRVTQG